MYPVIRTAAFAAALLVGGLPAFAQQVILPDHLAKRSRTQPVGQRTGCVINGGRAFEKRR